MSTPFVFVYGTLRRGQSNHGLLAGRYIRVERAWISGKLYDLPFGYPAIVKRGDGKIHGELYEFANLAEILPELDELEGYTGVEGPNEYERVLDVATTCDGKRVSCYVYVQLEEQIQELGPRAVWLPSGDWADRKQGRN